MTALSPARVAALDRLTRQAARFPDLEFVDAGEAPRADGVALDARDAALSRAIEHAVVRRWLTLSAICGACVDRRWENVDARIQAALLAGAAQLLFFGNQAAHAVVDDTVEWSKRKGRRGGAGFVNAVLRRIAALPAGVEEQPSEAWRDHLDILPLDDGRVLRLTRPILSPDPITRLSQQTSHGETLLLHWQNTAGREAAFRRALHGLMNPPVVVTGLPAEAVADAMPPCDAAPERSGTEEGGRLVPHQEPGFWTWHGTHAQLVQLLTAYPQARVQDPGSARPLALTAGLRPELILDACAGRGTKTRQLAQMHPEAQIVATDVAPERLRALAKSFEGHPRVKVTTPEGLRRVVGQCSLVLLDVPCSNTGVLARRPEARYRFTRTRLEGLVALQRQIVNEHLPFLVPGGHILFSTYSLENAENESQMRWLTKRVHGTVVGQEQHEPRGEPGQPPAVYRDGSFGTLLRVG